MYNQDIIEVFFDSNESIICNFSNVYCKKAKSEEKYILLDEYYGKKFIFVIKYAQFGKLIESFLKKYGGKIEMNFQFIVPCDLQFKIQCDADYNIFFNYCIDVGKSDMKDNDFTNSIRIKNEFANCCISFYTDYKENEKINELLLHNYLLFMSNLNTDIPIRFCINKPYNNTLEEKIADNKRLSTYIQDCSSRMVDHIFLNGEQIKNEKLNIGKLFPAINLNSDFLNFIREPIDPNLWKKITSSENIDQNTFKSGMESKYWYLLQVCQKYLFFKFDDNSSNAYTELRKKLYSSYAFYRDYISSMPLLSVLLFSQYDYYWRDDILFDYKHRYISQNDNIPISDLIVPLQANQKLEHYKAYCEQINANSQSDIKSLIKDFDIHVLRKELQNIVLNKNPYPELYDRIDITFSKNNITDLFDCSIYNKNNVNICKIRKKSEIDKEQIAFIKKIVWDYLQKNLKAHKKVVHELFEAQTISEGLLQMIENAVYHSGNGLLSIRIRDYNLDYNEKRKVDTQYLKIHYKNYFLNDKESKFYLEIKLSDINSLTVTEKFLENARNNPNTLEWYNNYGSKILVHNKKEKNKIIFQTFFKPEKENIYNLNDDLEKIMQDYYNIPGNSIHHFGLQIFNSVVTSKNGLFSVSGHNSYYSNSSQMPTGQLDIGITGTSYRILIPFINDLYFGDNVAEGINDINLPFCNVSNINPLIINWDDIKVNTYINKYKTAKEKLLKQKEYCISSIAQDINDISLDAQLIVFDFSKHNAPKEADLELVIKGLLTSFLKKPLPMAIINLHSHGFLETIRLISLMYNKNGEGANSLTNLQIYISGGKIGEEMLFYGNRLSDNASRLQKNAMTQGIMSEYWEITNSLIKRK